MIALMLALQAAPPPPPAIDVPQPPVCSVTLTVDVNEAGDPPEQQVYRYDAGEDAWRYLSYDGAPPPEDELEEFAENGRDGGDRSDDPVLPASYYADSASKLSAEWTALSPPNGDGLAYYGLDDLPKDTVVANGRDLSGNIRLRYLIDQSSDAPVIAIAGGQLKRDWRIPLIARIDAFDIQRRFAPAPPEAGAPGAMLPTTEHVEISASILGKDRSAVIDTAFSGWDCVPGGTELAAEDATR